MSSGINHLPRLNLQLVEQHRQGRGQGGEGGGKEREGRMGEGGKERGRVKGGELRN